MGAVRNAVGKEPITMQFILFSLTTLAALAAYLRLQAVTYLGWGCALSAGVYSYLYYANEELPIQLARAAAHLSHLLLG
jgi:hypothetical protein